MHLLLTPMEWAPSSIPPPPLKVHWLLDLLVPPCFVLRFRAAWAVQSRTTSLPCKVTKCWEWWTWNDSEWFCCPSIFQGITCSGRWCGGCIRSITPTGRWAIYIKGLIDSFLFMLCENIESGGVKYFHIKRRLAGQKNQPVERLNAENLQRLYLFT